ncbi:MAG: hypothetical protein IJU16_00390 [Clostridia bacterium]|nr:hypothetical protein [Clostridia bacterium]
MKKLMNNLPFRITLLSAIALLMAIAVFLWGMTIGAWFTPVRNLDQNAQLTSFAVTVQYSTNSGSSYSDYTAGTAIPITTSNVNNVRVKVYYQGISAAYLRVKVYGGFYNNAFDDHPRLPLPDYFWRLSGTNWVQKNNATYGDYAYYKTRFENAQSATALNALTLSADISALGTVDTVQPLTGELYIVVDAVQPDRYPALWGINEIPTS